jgi:cysteine desulfurase/selenocysteine lyase
MSIQRPDLIPVDLPQGGEETDLIARLANEYFRGENPDFKSVDPAKIPSASSPGGNGLDGGYPSEIRPFAPPVHPSTHHQPSGNPGLKSGAHVPGSIDAYPFGEPRCAALNQNQGPGGTALKSCPSKNSNEVALEPEYYFLPKSSSVSAIPLSSAPGSVSGSAFDIESVRRDFPALHQRVNGSPLIWLDNAATTHKPQSVIDATSRFYSHENSNIHRAAHAMAANATELFEGGREKARAFLGAGETKEIVFVRGTTEAINLLAQTFGRQNIGAGDEILLTTMEHHANIVPWQLLAQQTGAVIRVAPINDHGELILDQFTSLLSPKTKLVAVTHVSNSLGTINPVQEIIAISHAYGVPVLVDGAQSTPHIPINVKALDADFFVFSGHKIFGPTGIGVLYGKAHLLEALPPWQGGGNMIDDVTFAKTKFQGIPARLEAGTPDIAGVIGMGAAIDYLFNVGLGAISAYEHDLLVYATDALKSIHGLRLIGTAKEKASVLSFVLPDLSTEEIGKHLDRHGIAVRFGHHCSQPSLRRFGVESTVRPSLAFYNTKEEVDQLVRVLHQLKRKAA